MNTITTPILNLEAVCLMKGLAHFPGGKNSFLAYASVVQAHLMQYGYMLDKEAYEKLATCSRGAILEYHDGVIGYLHTAVGGGKFLPLYGDFPVTFMTERDVNIMREALTFYAENGNWEKRHPVMDKPVAFEDKEYTILKATKSEEEVHKIFTDIVTINQSLAPSDIEIIKWFISSGRELYMPDKIPFRENLCLLAALGVDVPLNTVTDVLRVAVYMSGGDISLPAVPDKSKDRTLFKFKKFSRAERKLLLEMINNLGRHVDVREAVLKDERWKRLGEILHPGEYKERYPIAFQVFMMMRRGTENVKTPKLKSWYGILKEEFEKGLAEGLNMLKARPGEFVRRIDWLMRTYQDNVANLAMIVSRFKIAVAGASNKVLFEVYGHFIRRNKDLNNRTIMIKGARKRTKLPNLPALPQFVVDMIQDAVLDALSRKFSKLESLGKTWVDPELSKIPIPTNMRSVNFSTKPVMRGQRIPIGNQDCKTIRPFFHWIDKEGQYDFDLSCTFVKMGKTEVLNYHNLKVGKSVHSGDIIKRKGACAEYVDIDVKDAKSVGYSYVLIDVRGYQGEALKESQGVFGVMEREFPEANKTWLPKTIAHCHQMNSTATNTLCTIIDLETMEYIFLDIDSSGARHAMGDLDNILEAVREYTLPPKFSVETLLKLHGEARGELVQSKEEANTIFEFKDFCNDYVKTGEFMGI